MSHSTELDSIDSMSDSDTSGTDGGDPTTPREATTTHTSVTPITISWSDLGYTVATKPEGKKFAFKKTGKRFLLKNLHGTILPGELTCIMGPSGAGKTTLLNTLIGKDSGGKQVGQVRINGTSRKKVGRSWKRMSAYVTQDDILSPNLTPREELWFSARLRVDKPSSTVRRRVEELIHELGLSGCGNSRIGNVEHRGISGGQRKRASIGVEMITDPSVLFLDEPTSGLDYSTSYTLVETLRTLASKGRTIVSTIHQPSTDIFLMFDKLILMCEGHIIYSGPTSEVVAYFADLGYPCPQYTNPAEYIMNLAKIDSYIGTKEEGVERVKCLVNAYRSKQGLRRLTADEDPLNAEHQDSSAEADLLQNKVEKPSTNDGDEDDEEGKDDSRRQDDVESGRASEEAEVMDKSQLASATGGKPSSILRLGLLLYRTFLERLREPTATYLHVIQTLFLAIVVGIIYLRIGDDNDRTSIDDRKGALFFVITNESIDTLMSVVMIFHSERMIFIKEHSAGAYGTFLYYVAKNLAQLPFLAFYPALFSCIAYWMVGFQADADKFFIFMAAMILVTLVSASLAIAISASTPNLDAAFALLPAAFIPFTIFSGLLVNEDSVPSWVAWVKYFSLFKYGFQILAINEFDGLQFTCEPSERVNGTCIYATGQDVLDAMNLDKEENQIWASFLFLFMQLALWNVVAYFGLRFTAGRKK
ncbi:ABC2 type transporter superfamily protein [Acanthamoeba castellanii str. Neff]|uniref:ABC2 type transporter superfamily protein n=1 Tax=Acanthamoeba castellanii (strain ATCC 30010 / Neff) TaxID=1257118 RepID=L8GJF4_ACACF|nr:ABC2 type transporter superfamily protein [Acanthamoeba castellanii str. Neff]ELR13185.1 ABC2 type transporter superfamily protein [Acanthamoeba castellanii str. Neff]